MEGSILIHLLELVRRNPIGFISEGIFEAFAEYHVVLRKSSVGCISSCLPSIQFGANDVKLN